MDYAAAQHLNPSGMLAQGASFPGAFEAADVHFHAGLGEREIARAQARADVCVENLLNKLIQHALQVAQRNPLVHHQAFHLVEHGGMCRVTVGTEHPAGHKHFDGRLLAVHHADLSAAGLGPEQQVVLQVKSILHIPGRVILRNIQPGEIMIIILNFRTFKHIETHAGKNIDHFIFHQGQRMKMAQRLFFCRKGNIHGFAAVAELQLRLFHLFAQDFILFFRLYLKIIDQFSHGRPVFPGNSPKALHQSGDAALLAQIVLPESGQAFLGLNLPDPLLHLFPKRFDLLLHVPSLLPENIRCHYITQIG